jgi:CubicO group peptidase (beta-lactamase class C family)
MELSSFRFLLLACLAGALATLAGYLKSLDRRLYARPSLADATFEWRTATPESQGMAKEGLDALKEVMAARRTKAFLVVRNDRIVYEWYAPDHAASKPHGTASLAKAVVGGLSLGIALTDGRIALDDRAAKFVPQWRDDPRKSKITIRHLGSHTSGLEDAEADKLPHEKLTGWKGDFWKRHDPPNDPFTISRDRTPPLSDPGVKLQYSNPGIAMLAYCVTAAIGERTDIRTLLGERLLRPIGVSDNEWGAGYNRTFRVDGLPLVAAWGGGSFTARALARIGRLILRQGDWGGRRILSREAVRQTTGDAGLPGHCGMGWWTNAAGRYAKLPKDAVWGAGAGDQVLLVVPSLNLIMVRNGQTIEPPPPDAPDVFAAYHDPRAEILFEPLVGAIMDKTAGETAPPPRSPAIKELRWAPPETIVRKAKGSDNWPMTWADDDALYAAYGDGFGFEPFIAEKLSLGFAKITGAPLAFKGENLRSSTGEARGQGAAGKKASGMLMVDGVLYLLARNAANAQLAWSRDRGKTWMWADWKFTGSFGCPTFLNFGRNYAGARDEFIYIYSPDSDSAYEVADSMMLARVSKERIGEREAYQFFAGLDSAGRPRWTHDLAQRAAVFTHAGRCYRSGVTYNAALRRYLLVQPVPGAASRDGNGKIDVRFSGGLAIYDAPEPWGPWTTAFFTEQWDVGPGDTASFPAKWMSADGRTLYLAFSGDDSFSVRKATLTLD